VKVDVATPEALVTPLPAAVPPTWKVDGQTASRSGNAGIRHGGAHCRARARLTRWSATDRAVLCLTVSVPVPLDAR